MKYIHFLSAFFGALAFFSCEEKEIIIPDLKAGDRNVLVEEITGVRCQACPNGTRDLVALQQTYGSDKLIVVAIHAAENFSAPYTSPPANRDTFRSADAEALANFIGSEAGYPSAAIDRVLPAGATSLFLFRTEWAGLIQQEFEEDPEIGIFMETKFNEDSRQLDIDINLTPAANLSGEHRLTVLITQDSIVDVQLDGPVKNPDYIHRHVLREVITRAEGDVITEPLANGALIRKNFRVTLPKKYDAKHCEVVAYVHRGGQPDKKVLQATQTAVLD